MSKVAAPVAITQPPRPGVRGRWLLAAGGIALGAALAWSSLTEESARAPAPRLEIAASTSLSPAPAARSGARTAEEEQIARARRAIDDCRDEFREVADYSCTFVKRERLDDGRLTEPQILAMKARSRPDSIYFKFRCPKAGREAIYVAGQHEGRALVHDVGIAKLLAGTLALDPRGDMAMEDSRHPITDAGIGRLIETIAGRWAVEMQPGETRVTIDPGAAVDGRPCMMIESTHPRKGPAFLFHSVKVFIDRELNLPIRFEAYDWPEATDEGPRLVEEYTFRDLKLNVGLSDADFDPANPAYSFGRF